MLFLVFLLYSMAEKGLSGFVHYEAALPIDFVKSDLFLDPSKLRGPDAEQAVLSTDLGGAISRSATLAYGRGAANLFGDSSIRVLAADIVARPDMLSGKETVWLPVGSNIDIAAKGEGDSASEQLVARLKAKGALRSAFNANFLKHRTPPTRRRPGCGGR